MEYSIIIKELRNKLLLTQEELAKILGVSSVTVCRWEKGNFEPTMKTKRKIIELCNEHKIMAEGENR